MKKACKQTVTSTIKISKKVNTVHNIDLKYNSLENSIYYAKPYMQSLTKHPIINKILILSMDQHNRLNSTASNTHCQLQ